MPLLSQNDLISCVENCINQRVDNEAFITFLRFTDKQMEVYEPDAMFHMMSLCSAGLFLNIDTQGDELMIECKTAEFNAREFIKIKGEMSFGQVIQQLGSTIKKINQAGSKFDITQHFDLYINDSYHSSANITPECLYFLLPNPDHQWINVKIWFPLYKPVALRNLILNGQWRKPVDKRPVLYAFGDSITQGFIAGKPSFSYVAQLADLLGMRALNQGIGNIMFNPQILDDLQSLPTPDLITVAYGTNDWTKNADFENIRAQVEAFFARLHQLYPSIRTYVITPIWRADMNEPQKCGKSLDDVSRLIRETAGGYPAVRLIDGLAVSPHDPACYADGFLHPNALGFSYLAARLYKAIIEGGARD